MKLQIDFSALHTAVKKMGADAIQVAPLSSTSTRKIDPVDIALAETGIEVELRDVETGTGLLGVHGRQVLLYIQDHGSSVRRALEDGAQGKKYHIAFCRTLVEMKASGRFERYVATNKLDEKFFITGFDWMTKSAVEGDTSLNVCKNCLAKLNYQGYNQGNRGQIFNSFSLAEFFEKYSSFFPRMPRRIAGTSDGSYTMDWPMISAKYRTARNFHCEACGVDLSEHRGLLHTHHKNGVKTDNSEANLRALCADCHRKQPAHDWLSVGHADMQLINRLRRAQKGSNLGTGWQEAFDLADPGVHGVLYAARSQTMPPPCIGYDLQDSSGQVVATLEIAWPSQRMGVAIEDQDLVASRKQGWRAWSMIEALEQLQQEQRSHARYVAPTISNEEVDRLFKDLFGS